MSGDIKIVFDTETTGLSPQNGDRIVQIAARKIKNFMPFGGDAGVFNVYINPERGMPEEAFKVHGISGEFLKDKPVFSAVIDEFLGFVGDAPMIAHHAPFDVGFFKEELRRIGQPPLKNEIIDTMAIAKKRLPGKRHSLDNLCLHFKIDTSSREKYHNALVDVDLLVQVFRCLEGGRTLSLDFENAMAAQAQEAENGVNPSFWSTHARRPRQIGRASLAEIAVHKQFIETEIKNSRW